jgi:hypothetical protein
MHKNATKCNKTQSKWCVNKHGASKIIDMFEKYHQGRRRHRCVVRVHLSKASPLAALDRIARRRRLVRLHHPCSVKHFHCAISSRVWRSHLSLSLITSPRLDLGFLVRIRKKKFDLLCCKTFQVRDTLESGLTPNEGQHSTTAYPEPPEDTWVLPPWRRSYTRRTKVDCWGMMGR